MQTPDLVAHLANLLAIMDHHEGLGTTKNPLLLAEFEFCQQDLYDNLKREHEGRRSKAAAAGSTHKAGSQGER